MDEKIVGAILKEVENESYAKKLGLRLVKLEPGYAMVEMEPGNDTENIFGMTHGGAIFSLIDEAFQAACNSHGTVAVALNVNVTYHHAPDRNSLLRAESTEIHRTKKTGTYDIRVIDENNQLIASCKALAYRKKDRLPFLDE